MPAPIARTGAAAPAAPQTPPGDRDSVNTAARGILGLMDSGDGRPAKRRAAARTEQDTSELEDSALESSRAGDPADQGDDGHDEDETDELTDQRADDAPTGDDADSDPDADPDAPGEDDEDEDDSDIQDRRVKVKVNGKMMLVTVAEAVKGYQRHGDYSRGTAEISERRTRLDSETATVLQQRQALDGLLLHYATAVDQAYGSEPDWDKLYRENPLEYVRQQAQWTRRNQEIGQLTAMRQQNAGIAMAQYRGRVEQVVRAEATRLFDKHPDWKDPVKGPKERDRLVKYAGTYGYKPEELNVADGRHLEILDKAEKYDALIARAKKRELADRRAAAERNDEREDAPAPVRVIRAAKPGAAQTVPPRQKSRKEFDAAKNRAARTGRAEDAGAAIARIPGLL